MATISVEELKKYAEEWDEPRNDAIAEMKNPDWSEEDESFYNYLLGELNASLIDYCGASLEDMTEAINWFKSIKDRVKSKQEWKPSEEMLEALYRAIPENVMEISEDKMLLDKLYQGLKYGKVLSKK